MSAWHAVKDECLHDIEDGEQLFKTLLIQILPVREGVDERSGIEFGM